MWYAQSGPGIVIFYSDIPDTSDTNFSFVMIDQDISLNSLLKQLAAALMVLEMCIIGFGRRCALLWENKYCNKGSALCMYGV